MSDQQSQPQTQIDTKQAMAEKMSKLREAKILKRQQALERGIEIKNRPYRTKKRTIQSIEQQMSALELEKQKLIEEYSLKSQSKRKPKQKKEQHQEQQTQEQ